MRAAGIDVSGRLGDHHDPNQAIEDALKVFPADEVVISTHPPKRSRWLESGVIEKARAELPQPVTHVVVDLEDESAGALAGRGAFSSRIPGVSRPTCLRRRRRRYLLPADPPALVSPPVDSRR